jgi:uncharacterized membrane protein
METKKSKYDTNPLDPDFVKKTEEIRREGDSGPDTQEVKGATRQVGSSANDSSRSNIYSEAPTRRYDNVTLDSPYPSIFVPPTYSQPAPYQPPATPYQPREQRPTSRPLPGIGLPEKWAMMLAYAPFYVGVVVSLLELFLVPRREPRVRFHAAQGIALHISILAVQTLFMIIGMLTGSRFGGNLFGFAATVFLVVSMIRVWQGKSHHIAPLNEPTQWFNQKIEPRNK